MNTNFEKHFYHDVLIKNISYNFEIGKESSNNISFILENEYGIVECAFEEIYNSSTDMWHQFFGSVHIATTEINKTDDLLIEKKDTILKHYSNDILDKIQCYIIYTSAGIIKILSDKDVSIKTIEPSISGPRGSQIPFDQK